MTDIEQTDPSVAIVALAERGTDIVELLNEADQTLEMAQFPGMFQTALRKHAANPLCAAALEAGGAWDDPEDIERAVEAIKEGALARRRELHGIFNEIALIAAQM